MELFGSDAGRHAARGGRIMEEPGHQGERVMDTPQASAPQRFDGFPHREVPHFRVLLGGVVEDVAKAACVEHPSDKTEVV